MFVSVLIHSLIDELDASNANIETDQNIDASSEMPSTNPLSVAQGPTGLRGKVFYDGHVSLHSQQPPATLLSFGDNFHTRLSNWLRTELAAVGVQLPCNFELTPSDYVSPTTITFRSPSCGWFRSLSIDP